MEPPPKKSRRRGSKQAAVKVEVPAEATEATDAQTEAEKAAKLLKEKVAELRKEASDAKALSDRMTKELKTVEVARVRL